MSAPLFSVVPALVSPVEVLEAAIRVAPTDHDREAYTESLFLVTHPEAPVSTDATYPWWTPAMGCAKAPKRCTCGNAAYQQMYDCSVPCKSNCELRQGGAK